MIERQYIIFISWFFGLVGIVYLALASINYYMDPFFLYTSQTKSKSSVDISKPYNELLLKLSLFQSSNKNKLIFGDSRGNVFSDKVTQEVNGDNWFNFSIGGATPNEVVSLIEHAIDSRDKSVIEKVIIVLPLRLYVDRRTNRYDEANDLLNRDFIYLTNTLVFKASLAQLFNNFFGVQVKTQKQSGGKEDAWQHWIRHAELKTLDWKIPSRIKNRYLELFHRLRDENIKFTIVLPPIHKDIQDIYKKGMPENWRDYLSYFSKQPETINCMNSLHVNNINMFKDPYHSNPEFSKMIFSDLINNERILCKKM